MVDRRQFLRGIGAAGIIGLAGCSQGGGDSGDGASGDGGGGGGSDGDSGDGGDGGDGGSGDGGGGGSGDGEDGGGSTSGDGEPVRIGSLHPQSPPLTLMGQGARNGMKLVIDKLNEEGGINGRPVEGFFGDTGVNPDTARQEARRLVNDQNIDMLVGGISSAVTLALSGFAASENLPYLTISSADAITGNSCNSMTFAYNASSWMVGKAMSPWVVENSGNKGWIHISDFAWGESYLNSLQTNLPDSIEISKVTRTSLGTQDYSSFVSQMSSADIDWAYTVLSGGDAVNFLKQADQFGLKDSVDIYGPVYYYRTIRQGAGSAANGVFTSVRYSPEFDNPRNNEFVQAFRDRFDAVPNLFAEHAWTATQAYAKAANNVGSVAPDDIVSELESITFSSPMEEETSYRECDHRAFRDVPLGRVVDGGDLGYPSVESTDETAVAEDIMRPCEETGCSM